MRRAPLAGIAAALALTLVVPVTAGAQDLDSVREQKAELQEGIEATARELEELRATIESRETELDALADREQELVAQLADVQDKLATRAREAFKRGGMTELEALISGDGPAAGVERATVLDVLSRRDGAELESATALRTQLAQLAKLREGALADLEAAKARMDERVKDLDAELARTVDLEDELVLKAKRQRRIDRANQRGIYSCPMARPFTFIDSWGFARSGGRAHKGVDIMAPRGNEIYAFTTGRVQRMKTGGLGGVVLYLRGDDGNVYYYAHLDRYAPGIGTGSRVEAGQLIAYNGDTGNARGAPHLHFEVAPGGGAAVNPYPYTAAACF